MRFDVRYLIVWVAVPCIAGGREPSPRTRPGSDPAPVLKLPPRPADAPSGSEFARQIASVSPLEREAAIERQIMRGNVPAFLRQLKGISVAAADSAGRMHTVRSEKVSGTNGTVEAVSPAKETTKQC